MSNFLKDLDDAESEVKQWLVNLGGASQYHIENNDRAGYDDAQRVKKVYETILYSLSVARLAEKMAINEK